MWVTIIQMVSAEPFSHGTGTLRCLQKKMATYRHWSVSLWRDPDDVSHCRIQSGQNWMAAYLSYILRMKTLFRGWPIMVHDTHTRRKRFKMIFNSLKGTLKPQSNGALYSNTMTAKLAIDGWAVTFGTEMRGLGGPSPLLTVPNLTAHPSTASISTSYYLMWHYNSQCPLKG